VEGDDCVLISGIIQAYYLEAVWNTSTVALRVVEGDEKGTRCLGV
jgi:hypothetical protein